MTGFRDKSRQALLAGAGVFFGAAVYLYAGPPAFVTDFSIFYGNLHAHTAFSDGSGFPPEAYDFAHSKGGLDFMAITEHNHTNNIHPKDPKGGDTIGTDHSLYKSLRDTAGKKNKDGSFVALYGQEFSSISSGNHLNVIGADAVIDDSEVPNGSYKQLYTEWLPAHPEVLFLQFNHAWDLETPKKNYGLHQFSNSPKKLRDAVGPLLRTIEVFNGPGLTNAQGVKPVFGGESFYKFYLTRGFHVAPSADQDNHHRTWGTLTDARTAVLARALTKAAIVEAIQSRRVYATADKNLRIWFGVNGAVMGSEIHASTRKLKIHYTLKDDDEPDADYSVTLISGGPEVADSTKETALPSGHGDHAQDFDFTTTRNNTFLYLKVTQNPTTASKRQVALTSPVWVQVP